MIQIRPFRNSDPPQVVEIWRAQPASRGLMQPISVVVLEHFVWSKPYFDRHGLLIAEVDGRPVGLVHAGFGPNSAYDDIASDVGVISTLQCLPEYESSEVRDRLIEAAESYLVQRGVNTIIGGERAPYVPFYHGVRNSSEQIGVLVQDAWTRDGFVNAGYQTDGEYLVLNCELARLRTTVDRTQRQLARSFEVHPQMDHEFENWWDICSYGPTPRSCFQIRSKADRQVVGSLVWWDLDHGVWESNRSLVALSRLEIRDQHRRSGLATLLTQSALKQLRGSGVSLAQVQVPAVNDAGLEFFRKLGFEEVARGVSYQKPVAG